MPSEKVLKQKRALIDWIISMFKNYKTVAIANIESLPAKQFSDLRAKIRGKGVIKVVKKSIILRALDEAEQQGFKNISKLKQFVKGMPAIVFSNQNAFELFQFTKKNKSKAAIKPGQTAPEDIVIKAGATSFTPGPIIGELGSLGVKTGVEAGKVVIKQDVVVAKAGDVVNQKLANILSRLGIEPVSIGLNITACYEDGEVLPAQVLDIDVEAVKQELASCYQRARLLALAIGYPSQDIIEELLSIAHVKALNLGLNLEIVNSDTIKFLISKAEMQALALKNKVGN